jgi:hypothetical protein
MNDDFDLESLSKTWQTQPVPESLDAAQIKKRCFIKKLNLFAITFVELFIILVVVWLIITAYTESWAINLKVGLIFGVVVGVLAIIPVLKSRITSYKMISSSTSDWLKFEENMSREALYRGKLTNYLIFAFCAATLASFIYEYFILESTLSGLAFRYSFGIVWLVLFWFINRHQMDKHQIFLKTLI